MDEGTIELAESLVGGGGTIESAELWGDVVWPMLLALALGVLFVWAWTGRKKRPRVSRVVRWGLLLYLLAGALGWGVLVFEPPEWFGWGAEESGEEVSP